MTSWRPVLLSALVLPGAGQLAQRLYLRGALYGLGSLALAAALVRRVYVETLVRLPSDPDELAAILAGDPAWPLRLASEIRSENAGFFLGVTAGFLLLWLLSVADAWRTGRRASEVEHRAAPRVQ